jgi:hypothetical protein
MLSNETNGWISESKEYAYQIRTMHNVKAKTGNHVRASVRHKREDDGSDVFFPLGERSLGRDAIRNLGSPILTIELCAQVCRGPNSLQVHKIQWLSKVDAGKIHGSLVLYLARRQDAEKLLREVRVEIDGETAFARPFARRAAPMRCFNATNSTTSPLSAHLPTRFSRTASLHMMCDYA